MKIFAMAMLVLGAFGGVARAEGLLVNAAALPPKVREALAADIRAAREQNPRAFAAFERLRTDLPDLDAKKRGGLVPVSLLLKPMGAEAFLPVVEELAFRTVGTTGLSKQATLAWKIGLLETMGNVRDPRSLPLFQAFLTGGETEFRVVRAAAEGLGKLESDAAAALLVTLATTKGPRRMPVLAGMGSCRRTVVAQTLAAALAELDDEQNGKLLIKSLGQVGNAWAWSTPAVAHKDEESEIRQLAAAALVKAFLRFEGEARTEAESMLMVVDAPGTPKLIAAAKGAAPSEQHAALDGLAARFQNNPTR